MAFVLTDNQLAGIREIITLKGHFAPNNLSWLNDAQQGSNMLDSFVNTFCSYELADSNYINIHLEANQYNSNKDLFIGSNVEKLLKHITYIIWTDKLVDGYLPARAKDLTIYRILERLAELAPSILTPAA